RRDQNLERPDDARRVGAGRRDRNGRAGRGGEHHQAHDRVAADALVAARHAHLRVELLDRLHEFRRSARVQAFPVDDLDVTGAGVGRRAPTGAFEALTGVAHFPLSTRLATVMYLRPASCASTTACARGWSPRTLASFTSMGRLMPAMTSTFGRLM